MIAELVRRGPTFVQGDRATSPTIGAIILIGVTVVVATTMGAQLSGLTNTEQKPFASVGVKYDQAEDYVKVSWQTNTNAETVRVTVYVGDQHRTVTLRHVGHTMTVDASGVTVHKGTVSHWDSPSATDGDKVSITAVAVKGGNTVVIAERTASI